MKEVEKIIENLKLTPHPEGGYYRETYRCSEQIPTTALNSTFNGPRNISTAIYFLLTSDNFSAFHKINQDEFWHFYKGSPIKLHQISPEGEYKAVIIGNNIENLEVPQYYVPAGYWFAAEVTKPNSFALVGCTVAPGFDFADFKLAKQLELMKTFEQHKHIIKRLTRQ
jgi:predicted cupin superfamily sugar epimerase